MKAKTRRHHEKGAMEIMEEAIHLLRGLPVRAYAAYYAGTLLFVIGFLFFWADMSQGAFAHRYAVEAACIMAVLYLWMKAWHAVFTVHVMACLGNDESSNYSLKKILNILMVQTIIQPTACLALPVALLLAFPFGWVYAFYQNVSVFGNGEQGSIKEVYKKSSDHAMLSPLQNHILLFILHLFGLFLFVNFAVIVMIVPNLLNTFFGVQLLSVKSSWSMLNTTLLAVTCALTYLVMDPLVKAVYTIRCFYGESLYSGHDLIIALKHHQRALKTACMLILLLLSVSILVPPHTALADDAPALYQDRDVQGSFIGVEEMDHSIQEVISKRTYSWRIPRQEQEEESKNNFLTKFVHAFMDSFMDSLKKLGEWFEDVIKWLTDKLAIGKYKRNTNGGWGNSVNILMYMLLAAVTCVLLFLLWKTLMKRRHRQTENIKQAVPSAPDLRDEDIKADALPAEKWLHMAAELMEKGDHRLALRALYLASLSYLAQCEMISIAGYKSNRDYMRELRRKTHPDSELFTAFMYNMGIFESIWYGMHEITEEIMARFRDNHGRIMAFNE